MTCVRPARERPIATRRCALWARDPRATTCVSWRGTRTVRATLCWIAWKVHCGVARCMPSFERSPADRGVGDLPHLPKVPTGRARQKYLRADEETTTSRSAGSSRHSRPRGRVIASGSPPTPLPASTASHVAARIHAFDHPVRTGPRPTPDAAGFFGSQTTTRCAPRMTTPSSTSATCSRRPSSSCSSRSSCSGGGPRPCTPPWVPNQTVAVGRAPSRVRRSITPDGSRQTQDASVV